ncbi:MAG: amidohydrolase [Pelolinea sp.]|nr:amidohydrolase [Pelolinea sp.]
MNTILITNAIILTLNSEREIINNGAIFIENGRISKISSTYELDSVNADEVIDSRGQVVLPGLINAHTHTAYYMMRGLGMDRDLLDWLKDVMWPWLMGMDGEDAYLTSLLGYVECIRSGTTSLIDNQNFPFRNNYFYDMAAQAASLTKLRVSFAPGFSDIQFASPPDMVGSLKEIEIECRRMIKTWHCKGRIKICVSPINLLFCSDDSIRMATNLMKEFGVQMHTHVAESKREYDNLKKRFGIGYIEAFSKLGALNENFQSVHSVWITDQEIELMAKSGATAINNPTSNMMLASGVAPVAKMLNKKVNVALGTDSPNNNNDMFEAMKYASLLQKVESLDPLSMSAPKALEMATINGARALQMQDQIGSLEEGKLADIIIVDCLKANTTPMHDPVSTLVYSAKADNVTNVMVQGEFLLRDGRITFLNENKLIEEVQHRADMLRMRVNQKK